MSDYIFYITLTLYWTFFFRKILLNPYCICASEALTYDFGNMIQAGRCWREGKLPTDPYHFGDFLGVCMGLLYPINILCALLSSDKHLDRTWKIQVANLLGHMLLMSFFAYHLFGGDYIGLFGALAWTYAAWHIKQSLWYVHSFCWITATLLFMELHNPNLAGVSLGLLVLSGHPRLFIYFMYLLVPYLLFRHWSFKELAILSLWIYVISFKQIAKWYWYSKTSITLHRTYQEKVAIGCIPWWYYITMFIPWRSNGYLFGMGYQEVTFYVTPLVGFFALFGTGHCWLMVPVCVILSGGGWLFRIFHKLMARFPEYWGYFAMLGVIILGVDGLRHLQLNNKQLILTSSLLAVLLLRNSSLLPLYPLAQWANKPSEWFDQPIWKYLKGKKVNNLPYPVYRGHVNEIYTLGYTGGNHPTNLSMKIPRDGIMPYNWFDYNKGTPPFNYHYGEQPNDKWHKVEGFDKLWCNIPIS